MSRLELNNLLGQFRRAIHEQIESPDPAIDVLLNELAELGVDLCRPLQLWHVGSNEDEYLEGIVLACTEQEARREAWIEFTEHMRADECDPRDPPCVGPAPFESQPGSIELPPKHPEWRHYHADARELFAHEHGDGAWAGKRGLDID